MAYKQEQIEQFDPKDHGDFKLSSNNSIVTKLSYGGGTALLSKVAKSGVHQWRFKLTQGSSAVGIGVWKTTRSIDTAKLLEDYSLKGKVYGYNVDHHGIGGTLTYGDDGVLTSLDQEDIYSESCVEGDVVDMFLDLNKLELSYSVNDKKYGMAFQVEKTPYRDAISAFDTNRSVELLSYKSMAISPSDNGWNDAFEAKCDHCDKSLKDTMKMKEIIQALKRENAELQKQYIITSAENIKLNEECKELQADLNEMTKKYNTLYTKSNIDESNYINWNSDTIADWILNLDKEHDSYEDVLRASLKKESVNGSLLTEMDKSDLHRFGIIVLKHKVAIITHINRLTNQLQPQLLQSNEGKKATDYI